MTTKNKRPGPKKGVSYKTLERPFSFGQRLFEIRKRKGLTQQQLAEKMKTSVRVVKYLEREAKNPTLEVVKRLSTALNLPEKTFFDNNAINEIDQSPQVIKPLRMHINNLAELPKKDQQSLVEIISAFMSKNNLANIKH